MINLLTNDGQTVPLSVLVVPRIATPLQNIASISVACLPHLQNLQLAHPLNADQEFDISSLDGVNHYWDIVGDHIVRVGGGPTAVASKLGYLFSAPVQLTNPHQLTISAMMMITQPHEFDLERFWDLESVGVSFNEVSAEKDLLQCYISNCVTRDPDGAYVARFPWRLNPPSLPSNFAIAERRTCQMLKRLSKTPDLLFVYNYRPTNQRTCGTTSRTIQCPLHSSSCGGGLTNHPYTCGFRL